VTLKEKRDRMAHARAVRAAKRAAAQNHHIPLRLTPGEAAFLHDVLDELQDERATAIRRQLVALAFAKN
jgi:arginine repressor